MSLPHMSVRRGEESVGWTEFRLHNYIMIAPHLFLIHPSFGIFPIFNSCEWGCHNRKDGFRLGA